MATYLTAIPFIRLVSLKIVTMPQSILSFLLFLISAGRPPFGKMPFLEFEDGKILAESGAMCKFVCGLAGVATVKYSDIPVVY